jgi:serine/threonine protein kinase
VVKKILIDVGGPGGATAFDDFQQEVQCLRQLRHHNVVGYVDSVFRRPEACIVLEYAEDGDLDSYLRKLRQRRDGGGDNGAGGVVGGGAARRGGERGGGGRGGRGGASEMGVVGGVKEARLLHWFRQMLDAVAYMHDRKFLHRDIKSANIFLSQGGWACGRWRGFGGRGGRWGISTVERGKWCEGESGRCFPLTRPSFASSADA